MPLRIYLLQNKNSKSDKTYGKWYGRVDNDRPMTLMELAKHMAEHNCPYSVGTIFGVLMEMTGCIRELVLESKPIKLDGLGIFYASVESAGVNQRETYDLGKHVKKVVLNYRGSDNLRPIYLTDDAQLEYTRDEKKYRDSIREANNGTGTSGDNSGNSGNSGGNSGNSGNSGDSGGNSAPPAGDDDNEVPGEG